MKHFMQPKSEILRENNSDSLHHTSPNLSIKKRQTTILSTAARKQKLLKENLQDPSSAPDPASSHGGKSSFKMKSPLPPRPNSTNSSTLKRKLNMETVPENSVQGDSDSGVKVVVRMRPHKNDIEGELILQKVSSGCLSIAGQAFSFDSVEDINATQLDIFKIVGDPVVEHCLSGFNSSVFAYGQTGSGKTYTMWGPNKALSDESASSDQQGITPRILERLLVRINEQQTKYSDKQLKYQCRCSFLEIYNEQITDLLDPRQKNLQIREDVKSGVYVENLTEEVVCTMANVTQLLTKGLSNRRTGATSINTESSRSHSVFTCVVESRCKSVEDGMSCLKTSRINLVDLAGSERQKSTGAAGERLKEAGNINKSLSQLGNLINILAEVSQSGKQRHIPYRDSKLTFLLQESLGGNAKLTVICAVSPSEKCKNETLSTLRFAQRAKAITNRAVINEVMQDDVNILRQVIRQLKDELVRMKASGSTGSGHGNYSTGWNARRSLNLLRFSLSRPTTLPHIENDSDEEMEIVEDGVVEERTETENVIPGEGTTVTTSSIQESCGPLLSVDTVPTHIGSPCPPTIVSEIGCSIGGICKDMNIVTVPMECPPLPRISDTPGDDGTADVNGGHPLGSDTLHLSFARIEKSSSHLKVQQLESDVGFVSPAKRLAASLQSGLQVLERCSRGSRSGRSSFRFPLTALVAKPVVHVGVQTFPVEEGGVFVEDQNPSMYSRCNTVIVSEDEPPQNGLDMQLVPVDQPLSDPEATQHVPKAVQKVLAGSIRRELALQDICSKQASEITQLNHLIQQYKKERECVAVISQIRDDKILRLESLVEGVLSADQFSSEELTSIRNEHKVVKEKYESNPEVQMMQIELNRAREDLEKYQNFFDLGEREVLTEEIEELRGHLLYYMCPTSSKRRSPSPQPLAVIPEVADEEEEEGGRVNVMAEELRRERCGSEKLMRDLEAERKCSEELEEAMRLAMEVHARLLEQYAELEEKHMHLLARHRSIQDGIFDVKKAATRAGVRDPDSRFISALAAEISVVKVERDKERRHLRDENRGLQAQLRDTAEALQAAGELLVRLKESEEATLAAEKRAEEAEMEMRRAYNKVEKLKRKREAETAEAGKGEPVRVKGVGEGDGSEKLTEPWFMGHDSCNI